VCVCRYVVVGWFKQPHLSRFRLITLWGWVGLHTCGALAKQWPKTHARALALYHLFLLLFFTVNTVNILIPPIRIPPVCVICIILLHILLSILCSELFSSLHILYVCVTNKHLEPHSVCVTDILHILSKKNRF